MGADVLRARERTPFKQRWGGLAFAALIVIGVAVVARGVGSGDSDRSVSASEAQLRVAYLRPLERAGLSVDVHEVCHYYRFSAHAPWDGVIRSDRDPMVLQQYRGQPDRGWDGSISRSSDAATIDLLKHNVTVPSIGPGVGWLPTCANTRQWATQP